MNKTQKDAIERIYSLLLDGYTRPPIQKHYGIIRNHADNLLFRGRITDEVAEKILSTPGDPPMTRDVRAGRAAEELPHFAAVFGDFKKACDYLSRYYDVSAHVLAGSRMPSARSKREVTEANRRARAAVFLSKFGLEEGDL